MVDYGVAPPGRRTVKTEPLPGSLVTVTSPPIIRASLRVMARPRPVPPKRCAVVASAWPQRPDCVAGHVRLELRNVVANYPFERSHRFAGIQPNSGRRDHSRLSCAEGIHSSGLNLVPLYCSTPRPNSHPANRKSTRL